jgi:hypothetical protein
MPWRAAAASLTEGGDDNRATHSVHRSLSQPKSVTANADSAGRLASTVAVMRPTENNYNANLK